MFGTPERRLEYTFDTVAMLSSSPCIRVRSIAVERVTCSNNRLQLSRITQRVLNSHRTQLLLLISFLINIRLQTLVREVYPSVLDEPASALGERDYGAFAIQKEEILR